MFDNVYILENVVFKFAEKGKTFPLNIFYYSQYFMSAKKLDLVPISKPFNNSMLCPA